MVSAKSSPVMEAPAKNRQTCQIHATETVRRKKPQPRLHTDRTSGGHRHHPILAALLLPDFECGQIAGLDASIVCPNLHQLDLAGTMYMDDRCSFSDSMISVGTCMHLRRMYDPDSFAAANTVFPLVLAARVALRTQARHLASHRQSNIPPGLRSLVTAGIATDARA